MQFDTALYIWFLLIVFAGNWAFVSRERLRVVWLLAASYVFYASCNYQLLVLIWFSTVLDYTVGWQIYRADSKRIGRLWLTLSLVGNLGVLALFKYADFFLKSVEAASHLFGTGLEVRLTHLVLPVGISFYTFQTLSYTIDIYRGKLEPIRNPLKFALFVSFFPQLVAGPIVRATEFLPQLFETPSWEPDEHSYAMYLLAVGFTKKVVVADYIAINFVDRVFQDPGAYSSLEVLAGVYGYAVQIYCDFSGYTDIAIGSALLLGFRLPVNFNRPYLARSLRTFWHRWHISLSSWLRDYLYIPLGGSRGGAWFTYRNLFITMLLGGLWHGASWNFVIWGAVHGLGLAATRMYQRWRERTYPDFEPGPGWEAASVVLTFHFVCFAWIFFRAPDFEAAMAVLGQLGALTTFLPNLGPLIALLIFGTLLIHFLPQEWEERAADRFIDMPASAQALLLVGVALLVQRFKASQVVPFIYFQF
ncbi:MAG: MBOAT family protein [Bradymonadaceae bacterium]